MGFSDFITTREGHLAVAENLAGGGTYTFVEIVLGDGKITTQAPEALADVISSIYTVAIASAEAKKGVTPSGETSNYVLVKAHFKTADVGTSFYFREIGVFAKVGDGEKRMVAYNNAYDLADYIDATASETQDRTLAIPVYVGSASDIAIQISEDLTYLSIDEFEAHKADPTSHLPAGGEVGQVPIMTADGIVWQTISSAPSFDNLLAWPDCTRVTEQQSDTVTVEKIVDRTTRSILKAERTTTENEDGSYVEVLIFYEEDGKTVKDKYTITTTKDGEKEVYYEEVVHGEATEEVTEA